MDHPSRHRLEDFLPIAITTRLTIIPGTGQTNKSIDIIEDLELFYHKPELGGSREN
jgi:hypothetical protein